MISAFDSIATLLKAYKNKLFSPEEYLQESFKRFKQFDPTLGSSLEIFDAPSIYASSAHKGILYGVPGLIKDNICQKNRITSCASKLLEHYKAPYDATVITRLKQEGAWLIGRANCDEFAMGSSTENSAYKKTTNPWDMTKVPGGSSGGSIACVAAGLVPWALGTETGGSVRQPAALCGIVGLKPTYGLLSRYGVVAYASSMDQVGIATRTVQDNALILQVIAGHDPSDATSLNTSSFAFSEKLTSSIAVGLKIGVIKNALYAPGVSPEVIHHIQQAVKHLETLGAQVQEIDIPIMDYSAAVYFILSRAEAASNLARFDGVRYGTRASAHTIDELYKASRSQGFGKEVKARIMVGNYVLSEGHADKFYHNASKAQRIMRSSFAHVFKSVDILICPTAPDGAFSFNAFKHDTLQMDLQDYFTCAANIIGAPALSVPCGFTKEGMPLGMQFIAPHLAEPLMLSVAHAYEQSTQWHTMHPQGFK